MTNSGAYFDAEKADRAVGFIECLKHYKGRLAGQPFILADWQKNDIVRPLFGTMGANGLRQYRRAYIEIPCRNGKTMLMAALMLYMLIADGEPGAEVYSGAYTRDQASLIFKPATKMIEQDPDLEALLAIHYSRKEIIYSANGASYQALSADHNSAEGLDAHAIFFDELHNQKTRDFYDVLRKRQGSRTEPLFCVITTAGWDRQSVCYQAHDYALKVQKGAHKDPSQFVYVRAMDPDADWKDEAEWRKCNPALGDLATEPDKFKNIQDIRDAITEAGESPATINSILRYHFNIWTRSDARFIDFASWQKCGAPYLILDDKGQLVPLDLVGRRAFGGLDIGEKRDLSSFVLSFPVEDHVCWKSWHWLPEEELERRSIIDHVNYETWVDAGFIKLTPGNAVDHRQVRADIAEVCAPYQVEGIGYDPWHATETAIALRDDYGFEMIEFGQGAKNMTEPLDRLHSDVVSGKLHHENDEVMGWMCDNLVVTKTTAGRYPDKRKSIQKIDGMVAGIISLGLVIGDPGEEKSSYAERSPSCLQDSP